MTRVRLAAVAVVAVAAILAAVFATRFDSDPTLVQSPLIGKPVPSRALPFLDQEGSLSLADLRGQIVVVNFWASWCVPCRDEHGELTAAAREYRDEGVRFVGIVYQDSATDARAFLDELGRSYDYVTDPNSRMAIDFGLLGPPETFFIDRNGRFAGKVAGPVRFNFLSATIEEMLLDSRAGSP